MSSVTKIVVNGKMVEVVLLDDNAISPEVVMAYLINGAVNSRKALITDATSVSPKYLRDIVVKKVFTKVTS